MGDFKNNLAKEPHRGEKSESSRYHTAGAWTIRRKVFISYSHTDASWLNRLQVHLKPVERLGLIDRWDDTRLKAGDDWRREIRSALSRADAAILLLSADFLASDFILSEELPRLLEAERTRGLGIFAVLLKPCRISDPGLASLQLLNPPDRPLIMMHEAEQESLWVRVAEMLESRLLAEMCGRSDAAPPAGDAVPTPRPVWQVPLERNPFFTGRDDVLQQVGRQLAETGRSAISGLGGIGKTQCAVEYVYRHRTEYRQVFWVRAATEQELLGGFAEIARLLDLPAAQTDNQTALVGAAREWLEHETGWLLVLDNADEFDFVRDHSPHNREGHMLVTSRCPTLHLLGIPSPCCLDIMSPAEAGRFLYARVNRTSGEECEDRAVAELAAELGYLPLALEQAAAYITANQARFQDYLRGYRNRRLAVLKTPVVGGYPESVATTWDMNFREVAHTPQAAELLCFSAFLNPEAIPLELVARGAPELGEVLSRSLADISNDPLLLDETLEPLYRYSLLRRDIAARTYSIHPIMQAVLLDRMSVEDKKSWAVRTVKAVKRAFPKPDYQNWGRCERLILHVHSCVRLITEYAMDYPEAGFLLLDAGAYLRRKGRYQEAVAMQQQLLRLREQTLGADHTAVADTLLNLAKLSRQQGQYKDAQSQMERALTILESENGAGHASVGDVLNSLSAVYLDLGNARQAEEAASRALGIWNALGASHDIEQAKAHTNLGVIMRSIGNLETAEKHLLQAVEIERKRQRQSHHSLSPGLTILGEVYIDQGRLQEAEEVLVQAYELDKQVGSEHPGVAWSMLALARLLAEKGECDKARELLKEALRVRERFLGPDHSLTASVRERLLALSAPQ